MTIRDFQRLIEKIYYRKDKSRGIPLTFAWFVEEVGELARALLEGEKKNLEGEFADVLAWLCTLASLHGVDLQDVAVSKYAEGCPSCGAMPCLCAERKQ